MRILWSLFGYPLSLFYGLIIRLRNLLYDKGYKKTYVAPYSVLCVGNLSMGGSGKTPLVDFILALLSKDSEGLIGVWVLSRGYKRHTRGLMLAQPFHTPNALGDEAYQLYHKHSCKVIVAENRVQACQYLAAQKPRLVVMDDGFQHRALKPSNSIIVTPYARPFWRDALFPLGRLRETPYALSRAQALCISKCPQNLSLNEQNQLRQQALRYTQNKTLAIFFTSIAYAPLRPFTKGAQQLPKPPKEIVLVTGIANAKPLYTHLRGEYKLLRHYAFRDHHAYTKANLRRITDRYTNQVAYVTTEKDMGKLKALMTSAPKLSEWLWYYVPMTVSFLNRADEFEQWIRQSIEVKGA